MSVVAIVLVLIAAFTHAFWNLLAKKAAGVGAPFVAAYTAFATLFYAPAAIWALLEFGSPFTSPLAVACIIASGVLHLAYNLILQRGYQVADLSIVYPVARGSGPTLSAIAAFVILGERVTMGAVMGLIAVVVGILILAGGGRIFRRTDSEARRGAMWGVATGTTIAGYTVLDGWAVKFVGLNPILLDWCATTVRLCFLLPSILRNQQSFFDRMRGHWALAAAVGLLSPIGYILILTALQLGAPLHAVAPAREMSMMIGALLGVIVLGEQLTFARLSGCAAITVGVLLLMT